ncbi:MAG: kelch repeat-containing protein [Planctomycetota bacterium]
MLAPTRAALVLALTLPLTAQSSWRSIEPAATPGPRYEHSLVFDAARGVTVLFGGQFSAGVMNSDTWTWDGADWTLAATAGPPPRTGQSMVYDPVRERVVMFGGVRSGLLFDDVWEWDGTSWLERPTAVRPVARYRHTLVWSSAEGGVLLFGGTNLLSTVISDTWLWDGTAWRSLGRPSPEVADAPIVEHQGLGLLVMHGVSPFGELTHVFNGARWWALDRDSPQGRIGGPKHVYDSRRDRIVSFGGWNLPATGPTTTWQWRGVWTDMGAVGGPTSRCRHDMAYDSQRDRVVLYGGSLACGINVLDDTWELEPETPPPPHTQADASGFGIEIACAGVGYKPLLSTNGRLPWLGSTLTVEASPIGAFAPTATALLIGLSEQSWAGLSLPWSLGLLGRPDCTLYVSVEAVLPGMARGSSQWPLTLPDEASLAGAELFLQVMGIDRGLLHSSTALKLDLGRR